MFRRRRPAPPAPTPAPSPLSVRELHAAYVASLTLDDLRGCPDLPVKISPPAYAAWLDEQIGARA